ncbi:non-ribosomal peptide synthase protein (TIGR01720 family)/amino acid adenylation domain-containing protein [Chitinophaga niastensis]|uniref:Non-ribosomal peptide synthase protein (TIGR01720 family)/amino acid adenylation domain-containing protein n=1 Tax=Chitinophaga niastensis TaxID=536980 RepID=A0A2P8HHE5_CHINA|nr:non-ribosomal peptide synthetase [Chitinophaga niastensis]PSL45610.1 non-ribosomal peptide synthase protein (TIGR01720 family)/amino acid adenylation domain-containing protein [Chitinophaga niastensis]
MIDTNFEKAFEVVEKARKQGVVFFLENEKVKFKVPKDEIINHDLLAEIKEYKEQIKIILNNGDLFKNNEVDFEERIIAADRVGIAKIPLSFSQERLWFIDQIEEDSINYHIPAVLRLKGNLHHAALAYALRMIVNRHEILRTVIAQEDGKAHQQVMEKDQWKMEVINHQEHDAAVLQSFVKSLIDIPFDLGSDHMLRAHLIVKHEEEHLLVVVMHHIASDGWSVGIIVRELVELYESYAEGRTAELAAVDIQYADYAIWQRKYLSGNILDKQLDYWKNKLSGVATLQLPLDYIRPAVQSTRGASISFTIDKVLTAQLQLLSRQQDTTLYMTLLAAFNVLLYHYSGQEDICIGSPMAGRTMQEVEHLIGFFINTLALRSDLSDNPSFTTLLQQVKQTMMGAYDHQDLPFEKIVEAVVKERDLSRSPLFQVVFALQNMPDAPEFQLGGIQLIQEDTSHTTAKFDLTFLMYEAADGLSGKVEYCIDLFNAATISRMLAHFEQLLRAIVSSPATQVGSLSMLSAVEEEQLLLAFNDTTIDYPEYKTIIEQISLQAALTPEATALVFDDRLLTYRELEERSGQLAHYLISRGVTTETVVPVCMERSPEIVVGMLGIMKAGGAYVPVDPEYPTDRIRHIISDTRAAIIVGSKACAGKLKLAGAADIITLDEDRDIIGQYPCTAPDITYNGDQLAYVIYTSGSTGLPKGVMIEHNGVANLVNWHNATYEVTAASRATAAAGMGFDAFGWEVWPYLCKGAAVNILNDEKRFSLTAIVNLFIEEEISHGFLSTALLHEFIREAGSKLTALKYLLTGGDKLAAIDVSGLTYKVVNNYGPTENSVVTTYYPLSARDKDVAPVIGRPVSNTKVYIINSHAQLSPVGVPGEICIAGKGVSRGYLNRLELTAEKFVINPFDAQGGNLYRTGDLGRWQPDGNIEYLGRIDDQVKIRGYRIELGEIENVLQQCNLVKQAVVLAKEDHSGQRNKRLVGYIVPANLFDREGIIAFLKQQLPDYMIPALLIPLEKLPLTANGKIDKKALPDTDAEALLTNEYVAPRNATEQVLATIWQELLGVSRVGIHDNFFELGGDSIITIQVVSHAKQAGYPLHPRDLFLHQTISGLSALLSSDKNIAVTGEQGMLTGSSDLLPIQQWYFETGGSGTAHFNQSVLLSLNKNVSPLTLGTVIKQLVQYHDALRFSYTGIANDIEQVYSAHEGELEVVDLKAIPVTDVAAHLTASAENYHQQMDTGKGILVRPVLFLTNEEATHNRLLLVIHHLAVDGVSWRVLLQDMELLLKNNGQKKEETVLGLKGSSYRQWYAALADYGQRRRLLSQQDYWEKVMQRYVPLKTDKTYEGAVTVADTASLVVKLNGVQTQRLLQEVPRAYHTDINDILLAALAITLSAWSNNSQVLIGLEGHGREDIAPDVDTSRTVGWFTNLYPVLLQVAAGKEKNDLLKSIKEQLRKVKDKGLGYGVLKYINKVPLLQGKDPWDIVFNYLGQSDNVVNESGLLSPAPESSGSGLGAGFPVREKLSVNSIVQQGELVLQWGYSTKHYEAAGIAALAADFLVQLESLIDHCVEQAAIAAVFTPSDYGLGTAVSNEELDEFLDADFNGSPRRSQMTGLYGLSSLQEGMLFHNLYDEQAAAYVEQFSCVLGSLDEDVFRQSWNHLLKQHSILRSGFYHQAFAIPVQCVYREVTIPVTVLDYRHMSESDQVQAVKDYEIIDSRQGFDLAAAPLMRITLLRLKDDAYQLLWAFHHIVFDGWSLQVMVSELLNIYESLVTGKTLPATTEDRYEDYIRYLDRRDKEQEEYYWRGYMKTLQEGSLLPFIAATAHLTKGVGIYKERIFRLDAATTARLVEYAHQHHITLNTLIQGVWSYLLYRYTGRKEIVYGITVSGRPDDLPEIEQRVGLYINTMPFHTVVDPLQEITTWLQALQASQQQSREHQHVGLNDIQRWTGLQGDLFDTSITFQNYPVSEVVASKPWKLEIKEVEAHPHTNYPLTIIVGIATETNLLFTYNSDLLPTFYVEKIAGHFEQALLQIIATEAEKISDIDLLTSAEHQELKVTFNNKMTAPAKEQSFVDLFGMQAARTPQAIALAFEEDILTYQELDERSGQLANYLRSKGVTVNTLVPLCIERSADMIVGILGILKAGGAYVPIEPDFPAERIKYMLEDTHATVIVSSNACRQLLPVTAAMQVVAIDDDSDAINRCSTIAPAAHAVPDQLLYVIYTSGSTGTPKGVMVTHSNLVDYVAGLQAKLDISSCRSFGLLSSIATDLGNTVLYSALISGGALHLFSKAAINDAEALYTYFERYPVDCIKIVPSHWKALSEPDRLLLPRKLLIFGGEALETTVVDSIRMSGAVCTIVNHYGPTETTIGKLLHVVNPDGIYEQVVPIGKPFSNTHIYVVNQDEQLCPVGVPGELYIGGDGVASGYLNNQELTASKFIKDIFSTEASTKLYRTGDLVKYLPDGNIVFLGRVDDQVKIRGYRVEPGEISRVLSGCELVSQGVVIAREDNSGNKRLLGYVIAAEDVDREEILNYLRSRLPEYMVPSALIILDQFPLMANGKIDRKALPDPEVVFTTTADALPETALEKTLAAIWSSLLEVEGIGLHDDFFALGGHSLLAIRVISAIRKQLNIVVSIGDIFDYPTIAALSQQLLQQTAPAPAFHLEKQERPARIPLSYSQERLWFIDQLEGSLPYHIPTILRLKGTLNLQALSNAFQTIVNRHEVLRTVIVQEDDQAYQRILDKDLWQLTVIEEAYKHDAVALQEYIQQLITAPFDLCRSHMLRAHLMVLGATEHVLVITLHHIASDGWSTGIIVRELVELYSAFTANRAAQLPALDLQYADYAIWQRNYLSGEILEGKIAYWKDKLRDTTVLNLPTDYARPVAQSTRGAISAFHIDKTLSDQLLALSREEGVTLFMTLLAAYKVLLYRYSGQADICVGTSIAGRTRQEVEGLIGFFINTLALRSDLDNNPSFSTLLQQVKQITLGAFEHQEVPFEKVVEAVVKTRDVSRTPLFQVAFALQSTPDIPDLTLGEIVLEKDTVDYTTAKFDLTFTLQETAEGLHGIIEYGVELFSEETIHRMAGHYEQLLRSIVRKRRQSIGALPMLTPAEEEQLLRTFNNTATAYPQHKSIIDLFASQVYHIPDATALLFGEAAMTYKELDERANQLAHFLRRQGVTKETLVPVCIERSFDMIIAVLGILKAGGAYVPVDPEYPEQRISFMLADTGATLLLSSSNCVNRLPVLTDVQIILLDEVATNVNGYAKTALAITPAPEQLAYVIYTSGSTGKPKGVLIEHRGVVNLALSQAAALHLTQGTRSLQFASFGFDASCYEIFNTLLSGGVLVLPQQSDLLSAENFAALLTKHDISLVTLPPSYQHIIKELLGPVKTIVSAGEPLNREDGSYIQSQGVRLINAYGPTENTVCTTLTDSPIRENNVVVIGAPIANVQVYILAADKGLCPVGVGGEICIGGANLARGYLNRPDLTAEKFIPNPYSTAWGGRLYCTGDIGRWLPDGSIEYLGRIDDQVKIRGYRIELGEIERVLLDCSLVNQAIVLAKAGSDAVSKQLVAYIVPNGNFDREEIVAWLQQRLPEYMIPAVFISMEKFPLTPSGKFDRKALPEPGIAIQHTYVAPRSGTEQTLTAIWQELLGVPRIGIYDNFFELGGHSLMAMRLMSALRKKLGIEVSVKALFLHPTIAGFAAQVQTAFKTVSLPAVVADVRPANIPLSYSQERLWFIDQLEGSIHYHIPTVLRLKGHLNKVALTAALNAIVNRHEVLRTVFEEIDGVVHQRVQDKDTWQLAVQYMPDTMGLQEEVQALISKPFDLSQDHMLRAHLIVLAEEAHVLVVTLHHIAADGWSAGIIVRELMVLYNAVLDNINPPLPALDIQYADYAIWERKYLAGEMLDQKLDYWKNKLSGTTVLNLPTDHLRPAVQSTRGAIRLFKFDQELLAKLQTLSRQEGATLFMTLLAAFKVLLYRYSGQEDICVGTSIAGRTRQETEGLIGFFINTLALRSDLSNNPSFTALLQQVKETTLSAYDHQDVPFEKVVEEVVKERDVSRTPLFQVLFELQNTPDTPEFRLGDVELFQEELDGNAAKFDLNLSLQETTNGLNITAVYCVDLFREATINRLIGHFEQLLRAIVNKPAQAVRTLTMLTDAEEQQLLNTFNNKVVAYPQTETLTTLFTSQVIATPQATALVLEEKSLTYQELDHRSNQLAHWLRSKGVTTDTLVPVCIERSLEMVIAILGIMKAGGAYVPVDPEYPADRIQYMLEDCAAKVVVSSSYGQQKLTDLKGISIIALDVWEETLSKQSADALTTHPAPHDLAYVIYTSGSTGLPKGVMVEHGGMLNHLFAKINDLQLNNNSIVAFTAAYTFDISVWQLFAALLCGGTTVIYPEEIILHPAALITAVEQQQITILELVPSYLSAVLQEALPLALKQLQFLLVTGEAVSQHLLIQWFERYSNIPVVNAYGPTEASDDICHYFMYNAPDYTNIPLGAPVQNLYIYVLDKEKQLCPVGVPGEICVSGVGVARGYLNRPDLTATQFIADPFLATRGRMYKTGDLGRWLPDGNIEYLGRIDEQVKIRGYRIELGEIESVLQQSEAIAGAVVIAHEDVHHNKRLVGYIVPQGTFDKTSILTWLKGKLPEYMVPSLLIALEKIPLTPNGKIDRKALPDPGAASLLINEYVAPRNETEQALADLWQELLGIQRIGIYDNFFELGGHSLQVMRLIAMIRKTLQAKVTVRDFFMLATIESLAKYIKVNQVNVAIAAADLQTIKL